MKKSDLIKIVTILLISVIVMLFTTTVNAENEDDGFESLTHTLLNGNNTPSNNTPANNTPANNTPKNNTPANSSIYNNNSNNSSLPKTGIADSIPVAILVVIFGISAVYAYKKVNDYKNI